MSEKLMKNIEDIQTMPVNHEVKPMPTMEEKSNMREQMFSFLDMSRMEETRLVCCELLPMAYICGLVITYTIIRHPLFRLSSILTS